MVVMQVIWKFCVMWWVEQMNKKAEEYSKSLDNKEPKFGTPVLLNPAQKNKGFY